MLSLFFYSGSKLWVNWICSLSSVRSFVTWLKSAAEVQTGFNDHRTTWVTSDWVILALNIVMWPFGGLASAHNHHGSIVCCGRGRTNTQVFQELWPCTLVWSNPIITRSPWSLKFTSVGVDGYQLVKTSWTWENLAAWIPEREAVEGDIAALCFVAVPKDHWVYHQQSQSAQHLGPLAWVLL